MVKIDLLIIVVALKGLTPTQYMAVPRAFIPNTYLKLQYYLMHLLRVR